MTRPRVIRFLTAALERFLSGGCLHRSAAIAYFALLSSGPILILGVWALAGLTGSSPEAHEALVRMLGDLLPQGQAEEMETLVRGFEVPESLVVLMVPVLLWTALLVFIELEQAVSTLFRTAEPRLFVTATLQSTVKSFAVFVLSGGLLVGTFLAHNVIVAGAAARVAPVNRIVPLLTTVVFPLAMTVVLFSFIYWLVPPVRVRVKHALVGGLTAAALWEVTKHLYGALVARAPTYGLFYGPLSVLVVTLVWAYLSAAILLLGAAAVAVRSEAGPAMRDRS